MGRFNAAKTRFDPGSVFVLTLGCVRAPISSVRVAYKQAYDCWCKARHRGLSELFACAKGFVKPCQVSEKTSGSNPGR